MTRFTQLTYGELDAGARARAGLVSDRASPGEPVLLLYPEGFEFLQAFLGCLYAGRTAVPAPLPYDGRSLARVGRIIDDAGIRLVLTSAAFARKIEEFAGLDGAVGKLSCVATDGGELPDPGAWQMPDIDRDTTVLLQYTSGSTSDPKGVVIAHRHLLSNAEAIRQAFALGPEDRAVGWLPHYHDMGLLGVVLQSLYGGSESTFMAPLTFLKRPHRWLELVSATRATVLVAPDFAYELCTRRVTDTQLDRLDLASVRVAINGAEPIQARTLREFTRRFAPAGFRPEAFAPCYGMAEITLFAAATPAHVRYQEIVVDATELEQNRVVPIQAEAGAYPDTTGTGTNADTGAYAGRPATGPAPDLAGDLAGDARGNGVTLVSSGRAAGVEIVIVEPATGKVLPDGRVGEIWLRGGHVAAGYVGALEATAETFGARTPDRRGPYLRTGDLGFLIAGELFVNGRIKDVLVINGRNIYPQDIEQAVRETHPALATSVSAAFGTGLGRPGRRAGTRGEHVVVIQEVMPDRVGMSMPELAASIRSRVARSFEIPAPTVALVHRGAILRTTSGKVRRAAMREVFTANGLEPIHLEPSPASLPTSALQTSAR